MKSAKVGKGRSFIAGVVFAALSLGAVTLQGQIIHDDRIRTWTFSVSGWNMEADQHNYKWITLPSDIKNNQILNVQVHIYSDEATPEVFNLTRLSGKTNELGKGKSGGRASFYAYDNGQLFVDFDTGPCQVDGTGKCKTGVAATSGFFGTGRHGGTSTTTFPNRLQRAFYDANKTRAIVKVEYFCNPCATTNTNRFWMKIGGWNMSTSYGIAFNPSAFQISPANILDMNASIYSDANSSGKIQVDNLEHLGTRGSGDYFYRGRGGILWYGYGQFGYNTNIGSGISALRLFPGPFTPFTSISGSATNFRRTDYNYKGQLMPAVYSGASSNRGWIMLEYSGAKSPVAVPYAFLTRAYPIGSWNMTSAAQDYNRSVPLTSLGVSANRIARVVSTIYSDHVSTLPSGQSGYEVTNLFRPQYTGGGAQKTTFTDAGGPTFVDENIGSTGSVQIQQFGEAYTGFYNTSWYSTYSGSANRGYVLIDYLAGTCDQGPSGGFKIRAIPGRFDGDCVGTSQPFSIGGAGRGTPSNAALSNTRTDSLTYVYKASSAANLTISVRVEGFDGSASPSALAGVMFRATLDTNSRNASMMALPGTTPASFRRRLVDGVPGNTNSQTKSTPTSSSSSSWWVRVQKTGSTFQGWANPSTSTTMPSTGWVSVGTETISFPATYYYGIQVSNYDSPKMTVVTMRNFTAQ